MKLLIPLFWTSGDVKPYVAKPGWILRLHTSSPVCKGFTRSTSDATPAEFLVVNMAHVLADHLSRRIGGDLNTWLSILHHNFLNHSATPVQIVRIFQILIFTLSICVDSSECSTNTQNLQFSDTIYVLFNNYHFVWLFILNKLIWLYSMIPLSCGKLLWDCQLISFTSAIP